MASLISNSSVCRGEREKRDRREGEERRKGEGRDEGEMRGGLGRGEC